MHETHTPYEEDIVVWAHEQTKFIHARQFNMRDLEHIAEKIEDVDKSKQRELAHRIALLLAHLLKWLFQPGRRGARWQRNIKEQRHAIALHIQDTPSFQASLDNTHWLEVVWVDAIAKAIEETGLEHSPKSCPWMHDQILSLTFYLEGDLP